jgi:membrane-associated protease RseP (regulator of RpoE activity)
MRRFQALLIAAGLAAAPTSAVAGPSPHHDPGSSLQTEKLEWSMSKGRLGVLVMSMTPELRKHLGAAEDRGVLVARVEPRTPAASAGITVGDVIVTVHGDKVDDATDVIAALSGLGKGQDVAVELVRDGKPLTLQAKLTDEPSRSVLGTQPDWFRDWLKPFEPEQTAPADPSEWLRKLRDWLQSGRPIQTT